MSVKSSELVKGQRIVLKNGWFATLHEKVGNKVTVLAEVEGFFTELGSIYVHDIALAKVSDKGGTVGDGWESVELSAKQVKLAQTVNEFFG